jgi:hypothetical protein
LRACRSGSPGWARRTCHTNFALISFWTLLARRALGSSCAHGPFSARRSNFTFLACRSLGTGRPLKSSSALLAGRTGGTLGSSVALRAGRSWRTLKTDWPLRASYSLRAGGTLGSRGTSFTHGTRRSYFTLLTLNPL